MSAESCDSCLKILISLRDPIKVGAPLRWYSAVSFATVRWPIRKKNDLANRDKSEMTKGSNSQRSNIWLPSSLIIRFTYY